MKQLSFHYHLKITLNQPITNHRFTLRCTPVSDARQRILWAEPTVSPADFLSRSRDQWGNVLLYGGCKEANTCFEVNVTGQAETGLADCIPSENEMRDRLFQYATPLTAADEAMRRFADGLNLSGDALTQAETVMNAVHTALRYQKGSTTVRTTAAEAFAAGQGVCQDFSHVMLAILRSRQIPCRYVVGMLLGEGESHAWVEVLHQGNWYAFDPTNGRRVGDEHIKLSHGRDYLDCTINRGVFRGFAKQETALSVVVAEMK